MLNLDRLLRRGGEGPTDPTALEQAPLERYLQTRDTELDAEAGERVPEQAGRIEQIARQLGQFGLRSLEKTGRNLKEIPQAFPRLWKLAKEHKLAATGIIAVVVAGGAAAFLTGTLPIVMAAVAGAGYSLRAIKAVREGLKNKQLASEVTAALLTSGFVVGISGGIGWVLQHPAEAAEALGELEKLVSSPAAAQDLAAAPSGFVEGNLAQALEHALPVSDVSPPQPIDVPHVGAGLEQAIAQPLSLDEPLHLDSMEPNLEIPVASPDVIGALKGLSVTAQDGDGAIKMIIALGDKMNGVEGLTVESLGGPDSFPGRLLTAVQEGPDALQQFANTVAGPGEGNLNLYNPDGSFLIEKGATLGFIEGPDGSIELKLDNPTNDDFSFGAFDTVEASPPPDVPTTGVSSPLEEARAEVERITEAMRNPTDATSPETLYAQLEGAQARLDTLINASVEAPPSDVITVGESSPLEEARAEVERLTAAMSDTNDATTPETRLALLTEAQGRLDDLETEVTQLQNEVAQYADLTEAGGAAGIDAVELRDAAQARLDALISVPVAESPPAGVPSPATVRLEWHAGSAHDGVSNMLSVAPNADVADSIIAEDLSPLEMPPFSPGGYAETLLHEPGLTGTEYDRLWGMHVPEEVFSLDATAEAKVDAIADAAREAGVDVSAVSRDVFPKISRMLEAASNLRFDTDWGSFAGTNYVPVRSIPDFSLNELRSGEDFKTVGEILKMISIMRETHPAS